MRSSLPLLVLLLIAFRSAAGVVELSTFPDTVGQGRTLSVRARFSEHPDEVRGRFLGRDFHFYELDPLTHGALLGIPVNTRPGEHTLLVTAWKGAATAGGRKEPRSFAVEATTKVVVAPTEYRIDSVNLSMPALDKRSSRNLKRETNLIGPRFRTRSPSRMWREAFILPARGAISSPFGGRRAYNDGKVSWHHKGVDIAGASGDPVFACAAGRVVFSQDLAVHGKTIMIDHGQGVVSIYCHLKERKVEVGEDVERGALIGILGLTGVGTGPHVHWGVSAGDVRVDPVEWVERNVQ